MPTGRIDHGSRSTAAALAAALSIVMALPAADAAAQSGSGETKEQAGRSQRQTKVRAPRPTRMGDSRAKAPAKMRGLGGVRAKAPAKMRGLGGVKIPFAKHRQLLPTRKLDLGGVRSAGPRRDVPELRTAPAPRFAPTREPVPAPASVERIIAARFVDRIPPAGGVDIAGSRGAFGEALRQHGIEDVEAGPRIRVRGGGASADADGAAQRERMLDSMYERLARSPALSAVVRERLDAAAPVDADALRREMAEQGYTEVQLGPNDYGFVRTEDPEVLRRITSKAALIVSVADGIERAGAARHRRAFEQYFNCEERCGTADVADRTVRQADWFVQRPMYSPEAEPVELSDLESAAAAWAEGEFETAAASFRSYLDKEPEDTEVRRLLGFSLLLAGRTPEGVEALGIAYEADPNLAARPLDAASFGDHRAALRRAVAEAVALGHRSREHRAWLAASVLMHAEGRGALAGRMLTRAAECGLPGEIEAEMRVALGS